MAPTPNSVQRTYLSLTLLNTLAASLIWGINTLFLLDAGLSNLEAFAANAFFTLGQVLFEIPTGIIADVWGRKTSYVLGTVTLALSTLLYFWAWQTHAEFWYWALTSMLLGLGFTFFSGATEAWLVDAMKFTKYKGELESVFAKAQVVGGIAMLVGAVSGGLIAQYTDLGVPYLLRAAILGLNFLVAVIFMKDLGFKPQRSAHVLKDIKRTFTNSVEYGLKNPKVRWVMLAGPFVSGVGFYAFYAMQPFLLQLYGNPEAYGVAGLAAAIIAGAQIIGGMVAPHLKRIFKSRLSLLTATTSIGMVLLALLGLTNSFWLALGLFVVWGLLHSAALPTRQAYLNDEIPSGQRATVLSFDSSISSMGGIVIQPALGKIADVWSYSSSFLGGAVFQVFSVPLLILAKKTHKK